MKYRPRHNGVVFERVQRGRTESGIFVPDKSLEGVDHIVRAIGPEVEDLEVGEKVFITGQINVDYALIPGTKTLYFTKDPYISLIIEDES